MMEKADRDPTMEEIVVALRETRRGAGNPPPLTIVGRHPAGNWPPEPASLADRRALARGRSGGADAPNGSNDIAELRDYEIERLLAENARLNERIVFLLKVIEREQAANQSAARSDTPQAARSSVSQDVRSALEAELRPVLLVLLRLLEKQRTDPPDDTARQANSESRRLEPPVTAPNWLPMVQQKPDTDAEPAPSTATDAMTLQQQLRQRIAQALDAIRR